MSAVPSSPPRRRAAPAAASPRARPKPKPGARPQVRRTAASGRVASLPNSLLIATVCVLLGLVVFLQVSALRANMRSGEVRRETRQVRTDTATVNAQIQRRLGDGRVEEAARRYGMVLPDAASVGTLRLPGNAAAARP